MNELIEILKSNLMMVFAFIFLLGLARTADMLLGSAIAYKDISLSFDYKKVLKSIIYSLLAGLGLILITISISLFPELLKIYDINFMNQEHMDILKNLTVITIILSATIKRIRECISKIQTLMKVKNDELVELKVTDGRD